MPSTPQSQAQRPYRGVFPVAPTIFNERGELDLYGQRRCIDFMIDAGSHGICILANFSEQFVLTDAERETVMHAVLEHVAGRVPVIVTTSHFSSAVCAARSKQAEAAGAELLPSGTPIGEIASLRDRIGVTAAHGGQVVEWLVEDGDLVSPGQPLLRLHPEGGSS